jgi:predicted dehydrogenase
VKKKLVILGIDHGHYREIISAAGKCQAVEFTAIAHETDDSVEEIARHHGVIPYDNYEECLEREKPDIVGIAMFNAARGKWVAECLERGIAVLADKPLCTNLADLERIEKAVKKYKSPFAMMLTCRCDPRFAAIKAKVRQGTIGNVLAVDAVRYYALNRPSRPAWMFEYDSYGGPGLDILIHDYDLARWITGIEWNEFNLNEIRTGFYKEKNFKDVAFAYSEDNKRILNLKMLWHSPATHWERFTVYGTEGSIELPLTAEHPVLVNNKGQVEPIECVKTRPFVEQFFYALLNNENSAMPISTKDILSISRNILEARKLC